MRGGLAHGGGRRPTGRCDGMPRIGSEAPTGNAAEFSWSRVRANCNSTTTTTNYNYKEKIPLSNSNLQLQLNHHSPASAEATAGKPTPTRNSNSPPHPPSSGYGIRHENVTQDGDIRHENVIVVDVIRQENVISPCMSGNIFAIIRSQKGDYAERLLRTDCEMERQAE